MVELDQEANICFLKSVPMEYDPELEMIHALSADNKTITPEDAVTIYLLDHHRGPISNERRRGLLESMQTLCKDVKIVETVSIRVSEEEFRLKSVDPIQLSYNSTRSKRSAFFSQFSCPLSEMNDRCTDQPIGSRCLWTAVRTVGDRYEFVHTRSGSWACAKCCDSGRDGQMCGCEEIYDDASFVDCQDMFLSEYDTLLLPMQ